MRHTPRPIREAEIAKLKTQRRVLRPNFLNRIMVGKTDMQFTTPTKAVIRVALMWSDVRMVLE